MKKVIAFAGSNSSKSINKVLATYVAQNIPNSQVTILDLNDYDLPIYGVDIEERIGIPNYALDLLNEIKSADVIVLSIAEHNGTYSTAFKNAFDWMSRLDSKLWSNIPMLLMSTSPGERGGVSALEIAKLRFQYMGGNIIDSFAFPSFNENFKNGKVVNKELEDLINNAIEKL
jgi:NAD(P)H-dependent FMN reductase